MIFSGVPKLIFSGAPKTIFSGAPKVKLPLSKIRELKRSWSHTFAIQERRASEGDAEISVEIYNLNVRGKREKRPHCAPLIGVHAIVAFFLNIHFLIHFLGLIGLQ